MKSYENAGYILFDDHSWNQLLQLTFTRPVAAIRLGILTIREKWEKYLKADCSFLTQEYLREKFPYVSTKQNILINGSVLPTEKLVGEILQLKEKQALVKDNMIIACNFGDQDPASFSYQESTDYSIVPFKSDISKVNHVWEIFNMNSNELRNDFHQITQNRKSAAISQSNKIFYPENIFIEQGAVVECSIINAKEGPVYIGKDAEIMEGSVIRGALALCEHSVLKIGTKIYGPTTIGPYSKVGGEINNSVIFGYSNKAHDGFLGNSVIGEWCNLGADTNTSNLKNNYASVKIWDYLKNRFTDTGLQFCGLIMGDHSKCGINTMFNTGTVVGVSANIFGAGFPRNFIPSFSWGGAGGFVTYALPKVFEVAGIVMKRRDIFLSEADKNILRFIFNETAKFRKEEK